MPIDYFTERKKEEIEFLRQNPGSSIEAVVRHLAKIDLASRITVRNDLAELEEGEYIVSRKDKPRSQTYRLFINEKNTLVKVMSEMNEFKEKYFVFLKIMRTNYQQIESRRIEIMKSMREPTSSGRYNSISLAWFLYNHFIGVYLLRAIFTWQKDVRDTETINKLYSVLFETTREIHLKLSELYLGMTDVQQMDYLFDQRVEKSFKLDPVKLEYLLEVCSSLGLDKVVEPVVDCLWNISSDYASKSLERWKYDQDFSELSMISNPEDWRELVGIVKRIKKEKKLRYIVDF